MYVVRFSAAVCAVPLYALVSRQQKIFSLSHAKSAVVYEVNEFLKLEKLASVSAAEGFFLFCTNAMNSSAAWAPTIPAIAFWWRAAGCVTFCMMSDTCSHPRRSGDFSRQLRAAKEASR